MRTVDDFAAIRRAHRDGRSIRQIAQQMGVGRDTVRKALQNPEPTPYTLAQPRPAPVFGPFRPIADAILAADETAPKKQRHTASQVFRRLVAEYGYTGGYDAVRRHLKAHRLDRRPTFIPLDRRPGHRAEADFGHIAVDFPDGRRQVPVLLVTWSHSNAPFAIALPTERTEAVLHGLAEAFAFFGCVPAELWWDNPKTVAVHLFRGRDRQLHPRYAALASHYTFAPKFCRPATATEKPPVGEPLEACFIVTTAANELAAKYHDRMPVIMEPADYLRWLDPETAALDIRPGSTRRREAGPPTRDSVRCGGPGSPAFPIGRRRRPAATARPPWCRPRTST